MSTKDDQLLINAFVDGELDLRSRLELEERMRSDPALARNIEEVGQLREAVRERADYHAAPAALRDRIRAASAPERARTPFAPTAMAAVQRWLDWRPLVASLGLVAILATTASFTWLRSSQNDRLLDDVVASHVRSTLGEHLVDVASSDQHTVKPWLSSKLDFSPPVNELQIPGSVFVGGRVDYVGGRPVAALVYKQGAHVVNSFVWPSNTEGERPMLIEERGYQTAHWSQHGMAHWVISDVNRQEFTVVIEALRRAESDAGKP
jgi:anti-sigma factor RsiW